MGKFFKIITGSIIAIALLFGIFVIFTFLPIPGNYQLLSVLSGSMEPSISTGSLVFVKPSNEYGVGDVVTRSNGEESIPVTHRIILQSEKNGSIFFQTQGDANNVADTEQVTPDMIIGKVVFDIPYMGYLVNFARTTQGLILFIIIPAIILVYEEVKNINKEIKRISTNRKRESAQEQDDLMTAELCAQFVEPPMMRPQNKPRKVVKIV